MSGVSPEFMLSLQFMTKPATQLAGDDSNREQTPFNDDTQMGGRQIYRLEQHHGRTTNNWLRKNRSSDLQQYEQSPGIRRFVESLAVPRSEGRKPDQAFGIRRQQSHYIAA